MSRRALQLLRRRNWAGTIPDCCSKCCQQLYLCAVCERSDPEVYALSRIQWSMIALLRPPNVL